MPETSDCSSISLWIARLKDGESAAIRPLWQQYFARLVALAHSKLRSQPRTVADEEDVALSAFNSFYQAVKQGRFPKLSNQDDLWRVLFSITTRKAAGLIRHQNRVKRGGDMKRIPVTWDTDGSNADLLAELARAEPSAEEIALFTEEFERRLKLLADETLRSIAVWKMEGYTNPEIAAKICRSVPSVERKLAIIREKWEATEPDGGMVS